MSEPSSDAHTGQATNNSHTPENDAATAPRPTSQPSTQLAPAHIPLRRAAEGSSKAPPTVTDAALGRSRTGRQQHGPAPPNAGLVEKQPVAQPAPATTISRTGPKNSMLQGSRYIINVYQWSVADGTQEAKGSILSQSLQKILSFRTSDGYAGDVTMEQMRQLAPGMSSLARIHKFCTSLGVMISDERISLDEYLALDAEEEREPVDAINEELLVNSLDDDPDIQPAAQSAKPTTKAKPPTVPRLNVYYRLNASAAANTVSDVQPADMTMHENVGAADLQTIAAPLKPESAIDKDASLAAASYGNYSAITAGSLSEEIWATVLRNCAVFYGWKVDSISQRIVRAPRAAFQLRTSKSHEIAPSDFVSARAQKSSDTDKGSLDELADYDASQDPEEASQPNPELQVTSDAQIASARGFETTPRGIPNFRTNDDSRIEVTACANAMAESLAKSDFSSHSTEASISGGYAGITAGVSAGAASSKNDASKAESENSTQTLVARYMYPRCDLFLRPEDLEPTPEFAGLLSKVKTNKSLDALRQVQAQYGQLFCQELTLGARLLSTKIITATKDASVESHKEQFKVSVGVSVQSPYGGASVKHESENGSTNDKSRTVTETKESNVFEACGGDTILANNPSSWANSVSKPDLWRVINREGLSPLIEMLSQMPGYEACQMWFVQAVPALSKYIRLNPAFSTNIRLKVQSPTNALSCDNDGRSAYYLGCDQGASVTPRLNGRHESMDIPFWFRIDYKETLVLFSPSTFRAPVIHGFRDFAVGDGLFGTKYNKQFASSQWELISPFGMELPGSSPYELKSMSRVILRTVPFSDPRPVSASASSGQRITPPPCHMTVFRSAQGVFLPAVSDNDEYQYWRIQKADGGAPGEPIKGGDEVRLSWRFADQSVGFRDYKDDVFGRRRNHCPPELSLTTLHLKVPWPRFEVSDTPTGLVMSTQATSDLVRETMDVLPGRFDYALQDLKLRIDPVENRGLGDSNDYMMRDLVQGENEITRTLSITPRAANDPMVSLIRMAQFGVSAAVSAGH